MSFRRDRNSDVAWCRWIRDHESELVAIGIPREVWAGRLTWWQFVDHGYHPPVSKAREVRFRLSDLSREQQHRLYLFLDTVLPETRSGSTLWAVLKHQFESTEDTDTDDTP